MAALHSVYRPPLPYQSLSTSTSWAVNSFDRDFPGDPNGRLIHTGQQLTGARFPDGRVAAVEASQFANLMTARAMVNRETVNEYHVNLESAAGQMIKQQMGLPFQRHSKVDPMAAAVQARDMFRQAMSTAPQEVARAHDLQMYERAVVALDAKPKKFLGWGMESIAVELEGGNVLKLTSEATKADAGRRMFDLPLFEHGQVNLDANTNYAQSVFFQVQPKGTPLAESTAEAVSREFHRTVAAQGYDWFDPGARQLLEYEGKPYLADYFSAAAQGADSYLVSSDTNLRPGVVPAVHSVEAPQGAPTTMTRAEQDRALMSRLQGHPLLEARRERAESMADEAERVGKMAVRSEGFKHRVETAYTRKILEERGLEVGDPWAETMNTYASVLRPSTASQATALSAIMPEHAPSPLQLERQIAHEVQPTARAAAATAQKMVAKETANELHTVMESKVGGFLKKLMRIPLKAHSQTDAMAAAASQVAENVEKESNVAFHGPVLVGILTAGALAVGGLLLHQHGHPASAGSTSNQHPPHEPRSGRHEQHETETQTERRQGGNPRSNTKIRLHDADLNMAEVDRMFANHFKRGYAYG